MSAASKMGDEYQVGGSLSEKASTYVVRQADFELYEGLNALKFCYVLNSRQMGKSSLRVRTMVRLKQEGFATAAIEMGELCVRGVTPELFYNSFISLLVSKFNLAIDDEQWCDSKSHILPSVRLSQFIEEELLERLTQNIVIFIDEIDNILSVDFKGDFFGFLRGCYNKRAASQKYHRLTFALLGVATPRELIGDTNHTPFNIETRAIKLTGFQIHEAKPLESGLVGVANNPQAVMEEVLKWTGGQPFLTQWLCQLICTNRKFIDATAEAESVALIVQQCVVKNWLAQDKQQHLQTIRDRILANQNFACRLLGLYQQLLSGEIAVDGSPEQMQLQLSGLVVKRLQNLSIYNEIYRCVFNSTWVEQQLGNLRPYAEMFTAWETSGHGTSHLLSGQQLQDAKAWAVGKSLSDKDYQFLAASLEWCHRKIVELVTDRWTELGGKIVFINPKYTSAYAFDGSGKVKRDKINYSLCCFTTGKRYHSDLNASYNIAARYWYAVIMGDNSYSRVFEGKSTHDTQRTPVTLGTLRNLWAA